MRHRPIPLAAAVLLAFVTSAVTAPPPLETEAITLTLDPEASRVAFTLQATMHRVEGSFQVVEGAIDFDPETGAASGRVVVDVMSGDTGNPRRDRDMHRIVLKSDRYPQAVFTPSRFDGELPDDGATGRVTLAGELILHGAAHEVTIPARVTRQGSRVTAEGDLAVPYVVWGMADPSKFVLRVAKEVAVRLTAVGELAPAGP